QVFKLILLQRRFNLGFQLRSELALVGDGCQDSGAPVLQFTEVRKLLLDRPDLDFIEITGGLFAIACDKRHGRTLVEKGDGGGKAFERHCDLPRDMKEYR